MKVSVIILNYNGLANTLDCLNSLKKCQTQGNQVDFIVIDNNSSDGSKKVLGTLDNIHLIPNPQNLGYTGGNNTGIRYALRSKPDLILILNNDTLADKNLIVNLINAARNADIISPKIYFAKNFEFHKDRYKKDELGRVIWYAGGKIDWSNVIGRHAGVDEVDKNQYDTRSPVDFATGACMLIKRQVFEKIGLFDEKYFLYLEDMDFCVRAQKAHFKIIFEPKAILWHKNAGSVGGSGSDLQDYFITRNRLLFAVKFARLKTKIAVFRQVLTQVADPIKRKALIDFLTWRFQQGSYKFNK
ncbi:hypothetical protein A3B51_00775 [Candidatus Curtissbacteria bacterium RIFCSPLOWO2_01_FULL_41_18]|uniref:Glycosyltransferase 2-like domain-containing protein n=1 Tax=Candidatus Curtissbacteria bacterium RIFCSPLOWO2_01_FULL_41_18 TaxID=1797727 RepID=A0A1F5HI01_9BACT|nr:MAG: hypothetical protein A3B51_00775 [Candidatus Curtissbacteria bacterium RIFCSPLOWO2_01_FULL_41_18]